MERNLNALEIKEKSSSRDSLELVTNDDTLSLENLGKWEKEDIFPL